MWIREVEEDDVDRRKAAQAGKGIEASGFASFTGQARTPGGQLPAY
jgi:hypothetical protein